MGDVIGDLNSRRGMIEGTEMRGNANVINSMVPLPICLVTLMTLGQKRRAELSLQ